MIVISARPFEEYFETVPNVSDMGRDRNQSNIRKAARELADE